MFKILNRVLYEFLLTPRSEIFSAILLAIAPSASYQAEFMSLIPQISSATSVSLSKT